MRVVVAADGTIYTWNVTTRRVVHTKPDGSFIDDRAFTASENAAADDYVATVGPAQTIEANRVTLVQQATQALGNNRTFVALASPTNAQVSAQVKALSQQMNAVIRLVIGQLDATN